MQSMLYHRQIVVAEGDFSSLIERREVQHQNSILELIGLGSHVSSLVATGRAAGGAQVNTEVEEMRQLADELGVTGLPFFNLYSSCGNHVAVSP